MEAGYPFCLYTPTGFHFGTWLEAVGNFAGHGSPFSSAAGRKALDFSGSSSAASLSSSTGPGRMVDPASYHTPAK